ncbi:phosphatidate phosphatase PAH2 [Quillaja saponaria]|uniref:Phosphatidate phosphatase PAH2 n=1 Tax=Quillaja saponaria TaxID=32244 RepID=A0AAD7LHA2_QUISA|nr:phosphatidate phosphatase PAH2 [Quillaja saponaria]
MSAVERLGSYITRGVFSVSGPFHPFGGAVDIVVVEQPDGSFKSSPWYVRFGKFQGVLKTKEKVVIIGVNGIEADFHMYLNHKGEAYFLKEVDLEEVESVLYQSLSGDETDGQSQKVKLPLKSKSLNFDSKKLSSVDDIDVKNPVPVRPTEMCMGGEIVERTNSRRSQILGLVFGRRSMKGGDYKEEVDGTGMARRDSLEHAELAANLLEVKWSTNLATKKILKDNSSRFSASDILGGRSDKDINVDEKQCHGNSSEHDFTLNSLHCSELHKEASYCNAPAGISSMSGFEVSRQFVKKDSVDFSRLTTMKQVVQSSTIGESVLDEQSEVMVTSIDKYVGGAEHDRIVNKVISASIEPNSPNTPTGLEVCPHMHVNGEKVFGERVVGSPACGIFSEEIPTDGVHSIVHCEKSDSSLVAVDCSEEQIEMLHLACRGQVQSHHAATELLPEVTATEEFTKDINLDIKQMAVHEIDSQEPDFSDSSVSSCNVANIVKLPTSEKSEMINVESRPDSVEVESPGIGANSSFSSSASQVQDEDEDVSSKFSPHLQSVGDPFFSKGTSAPLSVSSDDRCFLFGDLDEYIINAQGLESISPRCVEEEDDGTNWDGTEKVDQSVNTNSSSHSCSENSSKKIPPTDVDKLKIVSSPLDITRNHKVDRKEVGQLVGSLPNVSSNTNCLDTNVLHYTLRHSLDSKFKSLEWALPSKDKSRSVKSKIDKENLFLHEQPTVKHPSLSGEFENASASPTIVAPIVLGMISSGSAKILEPKGMIPIEQVGKDSTMDPSTSSISPGGNWRLWPFSFRRTRSSNAIQPAPNGTTNFTAENVSESTIGIIREKSELKSKLVKKMVRATTPASEQLASLNLKEGSNIVTFTFSTAMLGKQQVDARIYLWKWNSQIVISDVDGTITKSDVLGQFMPLVGIDWSQTGVAHLFSAIKENGYHLLFLSARAISQAYRTRQFLFNLKQDGKTLPDGPVCISPDGLFPSLYREVIRRAPHEFKIACLEDIRALFPSDCNPFYAGFGNRDTDEISYLKVGIPKGKVFIINPKGEVAVNHRVDRKSYTSFHALVNGMFPPMNTSEQEDFNSWNYWKLPDPVIDI